MPTFNDARIRHVNQQPLRKAGSYILYWMQAYRRFDRNHALDYALHQARSLKKPLIIYEGLGMKYPWASDRTHRYMLEGMIDNQRIAKERGITYWPYVETPDNPARGLLRKLASDACLVVTDDYPCFVVPAQTRSLASKTETPVHSVDGNGLVPLAMLGETSAAMNAHMRPRIHKLVAEAWNYRAHAEPDFSGLPKASQAPPFPTMPLQRVQDIPAFLAQLPIDHTVKPAREMGGHTAGQAKLQEFVSRKLKFYADGRNQPNDPAETAGSGLSALLRHGHISIQQVAETVLAATGEWTPAQIDMKFKGKKENFYTRDANVESFLDEAITWRDLGYHWHYTRWANIQLKNATSPAALRLRWPHPTYQDLDSALPPWARASLQKHDADPREHTYTLEQWEAADTHDDLWNAAMIELKESGRMHNYLRMLWGKKILEYSASHDEAYFTLEHLNNKYMIDGRDPNSYTGILWCFGLFDRPWPPERKVFGNIRYMSSASTAKKFKLDAYYRYIHRLQKASTAEVKS